MRRRGTMLDSARHAHACASSGASRFVRLSLAAAYFLNAPPADCSIVQIAPPQKLRIGRVAQGDKALGHDYARRTRRRQQVVRFGERARRAIARDLSWEARGGSARALGDARDQRIHLG